MVSFLAADSEASEWQSSHSPLTRGALRLWRWPMKCQRKASPWHSCFAWRSWARFSPTTSTPASASAARSSSATYFVAATTVTSGPTSSRMRSYRSRISAGDVGDHSLSAGAAGVAPVREERLGLTGGAAVEAVDALDSRAVERALGARPEVEVAPPHGVAPAALAAA